LTRSVVQAGPPVGRDEGIEMVLVHHGVDAFRAREAVVLLEASR
jgi:hypothetical protein